MYATFLYDFVLYYSTYLSVKIVKLDYKHQTLR